MKNKEIQEKRMKNYFVQATKEILKAEGVKSLSVRSIADKAGYSYATLYNYFKDVNELIFLCVSDFQTECEQFVLKTREKANRGKESIQVLAHAYINYFLEYPGIFELFYIEKIGDFGTKSETLALIDHSLNRICKPEWDYCLEQGLLDAIEIENKRENLKHTVIAMLLLYLNRHIPSTYEEFQNKVEKNLAGVLS